MTNNIQYLEDGKALKGYDVISVFNGSGVAGKEHISSVYLGGIYLFESQKNKEIFEADPQKYAPKYGGHCSTAMSEGALVEANPLSSLLQDGELHVFYKDDNEDTQDEWNEKPIALKKLAELEWVGLLQKK
ncbi:MAG: YHS domain-containing (seleno)protein [Bacteroidota bacterium]